MAASVSDGSLAVPEGTLYWKYETPSPTPTQDKTQPTLLFLHAAVSDHTVWDGQIPFFVSQGYACLRVDRFGFGLSQPSQNFLDSQPRPPVDHVEHIRLLLDHVLPGDAPPAKAKQVIAIGLSMGGGLAFDLATNSATAERVAGLVEVAGGMTDNGEANTAEEEALFAEAERLLSASGTPSADPEALARLQVRIWGDGPLQPPGRMAKDLAERMLAWNREIAARELGKTGGTALAMVDLGAPAPRWGGVKVPTLVAYGVYDETYTTTGMKLLAAGVEGAEVKAFEAAHMIPMERFEEFNEWLGAWLEAKFA